MKRDSYIGLKHFWVILLSAFCITPAWAEFDFSKLKVLQNIPTGNWQSTTTLEPEHPKKNFKQERETCASATEISAGLKDMGRQIKCPDGSDVKVVVQSDTSTSARLVESCPASTIQGFSMPAMVFPIKVERKAADHLIAEVMAPSGVKMGVAGNVFYRFEAKRLGDCKK